MEKKSKFRIVSDLLEFLKIQNLNSIDFAVAFTCK